MDHRIDILRVPPAPRGSRLFVLYAGTNTQIQIYSDRALQVPIPQPYLMELVNMHWYVAENVRVDIKILSHIYPGGFILIQDQMMINPATVMNLTYTFLDSSLVISNEGNIYTEAI